MENLMSFSMFCEIMDRDNIVPYTKDDERKYKPQERPRIVPKRTQTKNCEKEYNLGPTLTGSKVTNSVKFHPHLKR